jgi:hypothetical protein
MVMIPEEGGIVIVVNVLKVKVPEVKFIRETLTPRTPTPRNVTDHNVTQHDTILIIEPSRGEIMVLMMVKV